MKNVLKQGLLISATSFLFFSVSCSAQKENSGDKKLNEIVSSKEVKRIVSTLASDEMRGRKTFTPDIDKAADFVANEFKAAGLQKFDSHHNYKQEFSMVTAKLQNLFGTFDNAAIDEKNVVVITCQPEIIITENSGFEKIAIPAGKNFFSEARKLIQANKNYFVLVDTSYSRNFSRLSGLKRGLFKSDKSVVFVLTDSDPQKFSIEAHHEISEQKLANVVGVLPGKSKKDEYVIFSGHYDHIGIGRPVDGDSIYNGANDDAAGTTAVILLAKYFKALGNNERTLVFAAFTAEEVGGFGSQYFSRQFDPEKVQAMFNIEMIGTESKWGKNSAYITGFEKTDMGAILQKSLEGSGFTFYPDPYPQQQLFYRSDNATLARLGVPAHTISTSKMDSEPNYHKVSDEVETLDMENMTEIIKAIAISSKSIIAGKETPSRVKVEELR
ncbi:MAG TPA: M20/M25/M40 family metallo-hydrolase [Chitinophagaceae bacterium]|nr:M20/M25/M40 family metallo-hydrolase [Chitinophagaceae bacterium]